jgi:hypothetical protein
VRNRTKCIPKLSIGIVCFKEQRVCCCWRSPRNPLASGVVIAKGDLRVLVKREIHAAFRICHYNSSFNILSYMPLFLFTRLDSSNCTTALPCWLPTSQGLSLCQVTRPVSCLTSWPARNNCQSAASRTCWMVARASRGFCITARIWRTSRHEDRLLRDIMWFGLWHHLVLRDIKWFGFWHHLELLDIMWFGFRNKLV